MVTRTFKRVTLNIAYAYGREVKELERFVDVKSYRDIKKFVKTQVAGITGAILLDYKVTASRDVLYKMSDEDFLKYAEVSAK